MATHVATARAVPAASTDDLVLLHQELRVLTAQMDAQGREYAAQAADERSQAVSAELRDRLESWLGNVPVAEFLECL